MCAFVCLSLVAELRRHNPDFPEVSGGVLVQQVIPDTPAQKYVHRYVEKKKKKFRAHTHTARNEISLHQSSIASFWWFHKGSCNLWHIGKILQ